MQCFLNMLIYKLFIPGNFDGYTKVRVKPAVVAEWSKALSQIQLERMP